MHIRHPGTRWYCCGPERGAKGASVGILIGKARGGVRAVVGGVRAARHPSKMATRTPRGARRGTPPKAK